MNTRSNKITNSQEPLQSAANAISKYNPENPESSVAVTEALHSIYSFIILPGLKNSSENISLNNFSDHIAFIAADASTEITTQYNLHRTNLLQEIAEINNYNHEKAKEIRIALHALLGAYENLDEEDADYNYLLEKGVIKFKVTQEIPLAPSNSEDSHKQDFADTESVSSTGSDISNDISNNKDGIESGNNHPSSQANNQLQLPEDKNSIEKALWDIAIAQEEKSLQKEIKSIQNLMLELVKQLEDEIENKIAVLMGSSPSAVKIDLSKNKKVCNDPRITALNSLREIKEGSNNLDDIYNTLINVSDNPIEAVTQLENGANALMNLKKEAEEAYKKFNQTKDTFSKIQGFLTDVLKKVLRLKTQVVRLSRSKIVSKKAIVYSTSNTLHRFFKKIEEKEPDLKKKFEKATSTYLNLSRRS